MPLYKLVVYAIYELNLACRNQGSTTTVHLQMTMTSELVAPCALSRLHLVPAIDTILRW